MRMCLTHGDKTLPPFCDVIHTRFSFEKFVNAFVQFRVMSDSSALLDTDELVEIVRVVLEVLVVLEMSVSVECVELVVANRGDVSAIASLDLSQLMSDDQEDKVFVFHSLGVFYLLCVIFFFFFVSRTPRFYLGPHPTPLASKKYVKNISQPQMCGPRNNKRKLRFPVFILKLSCDCVKF